MKIKISVFLLVEFSRYSNSQIYMENSQKFIYLLLCFQMTLQTVKLVLWHHANVNKKRNSF